MVGLALYLNGERSPLVIEARPVPEPASHPSKPRLGRVGILGVVAF